VTLLVERTVLPEALVDWLELELEAERVASEVLRAVLPVERVVRVFWSTVPELRLVEEPELRLVELPVLRLVRVF
jgi:hypothetical protein